MRWSELKTFLFILLINFIIFIFVVFDWMTKYLVFFLKYYPNCVSILYKKCCGVVLLTKGKRTFFTIVFSQIFRTLYFVRALVWSFPPIFYKRTKLECHIIKNLLTSTVRAVSPRLQFSTVRTASPRGWIFSRTALTLGQ
jgi:hypothetical protein